MIAVELADLRKGDEDAWLHFCEMLAPKIRFVVDRRLHSYGFAVVEDLVAEVFCKLVALVKSEFFNGINDLKHLQACALVKADWLCLDFLRRKKIDVPLEPANETAAPDASPDSVAWERELTDLVYSLLTHLSSKRRAILFKTFLEGKTLQETAEELQIPLGTACVERRRALSDLHNMIEQRPALVKEVRTELGISAKAVVALLFL